MLETINEEKIPRNYRLLRKTIRGIGRLAQLTKRGKSDVIDWLVEDALDRIEQPQRESVAAEQTDK